MSLNKNFIMKKVKKNIIVKRKLSKKLLANNPLNNLKRTLSHFDYLNINIASPQKIKSWAQYLNPVGVILGSIIEYQELNLTSNPAPNSLFCEKIFGPIKNYECICNKYIFIKNKNVYPLKKRTLCEICGVEYALSITRRYRMGYIELNFPIIHLWYLKTYLKIFLQSINSNFSLSIIEDIIYFKKSILYIFHKSKKVTKNYNVKDFVIKKHLFIKNFSEDFYFRNGPEIIKGLLENITLITLTTKLRNFLYLKNKNFDKNFYLKNLRIFESFLNTQTEPSWILLTILPVLPPSLRPLTFLKDEGIVKAEINTIYKTILLTNNQLLRFLNSYSTIPFTKNKNSLKEKFLLNIFASNLYLKKASLLVGNDTNNKDKNFFKQNSNLEPNIEILGTKKFLIYSQKLNSLLKINSLDNITLNNFEYERNKLLVYTEKYAEIFLSPTLLSLKRLLQEKINTLIDDQPTLQNKIQNLNEKSLKSITEHFEGKEGRFRLNLVGKRLNYSARTVITVGPTLRLNQCGISYNIALKLFEPFILRKLKNILTSKSVIFLKLLLQKRKLLIWSLLKKVIKNYNVLLNRAPTLHKHGIQAFEPVILLSQSISLHPLACTGFNADFDGDQMALHLPLYKKSQLEIRNIMQQSPNIFSSNGDIILKPTQDMVIGCYYLTSMIFKQKSLVQKWFGNLREALSSFYQKKISLHTSILVRYSIKNLKIYIKNNKLILVNTNILDEEKMILLYNFFKKGPNGKTYYFLTNIGLLIANLKNNIFYIIDLFIETSPGRIIFNTSFKFLNF